MADTLGLEPIPSTLWPLEVDGQARDLALAGQDFPAYYAYCVENRMFNFILNDGAFVQFSSAVSNRRHDVRCCYVPSPFEPVAVHGDADHSDEGPIDRVLKNNATPIFRFEYAELEYRKFAHPAGHLHLGFVKSGRLMVDRILLPLEFFGLVCRWLYPTSWFAQTDQDVSYDGYIRERAFAKGLGDSRVIGAEYLDERETSLLFLGARRVAAGA